MKNARALLMQAEEAERRGNHQLAQYLADEAFRLSQEEDRKYLSQQADEYVNEIWG